MSGEHVKIFSVVNEYLCIDDSFHRSSVAILSASEIHEIRLDDWKSTQY